MPMVTRSVRAISGLIFTSDAASMTWLLGKQKRYSTPSALRMLAIACVPLNIGAPREWEGNLVVYLSSQMSPT